MSVYLVSYDLNKNSKDYEGLYNVLKVNQAWWHYLENTWLVVSSLDKMSFYNQIKPHIDEDDSLFIIELEGNNYTGWLPQKAWDWLDKNLPKQP